MKKTRRLQGLLLVSIVAVTIFSACNKNEEDEILPLGKYENGALISNEGGFGNSNGSVSFYSYDEDSVYNNVFEAVNERTLGDVVQSITLHEDKVYIIINNSNKIEVAKQNILEEAGVIIDVTGPRYFAANSNTGYVSCWGDNTVKTIDLSSMEVSGSIAVGSGPEKMLIQSEKLYVANAGGWGTDSIVSVIDLSINAVVASIEVKYAPIDLVADNTGNVWVLSSGKVVYQSEEPYAIIEETPSMLYKIDPATDQVVASFELFTNQHPSHLEIDANDNLYVGGGYTFAGVYKYTIEGSTATSTKIIDDYVYGVNNNSVKEEIWVTVATSYTVAGQLKRYNYAGELQGTHEVGIGPNGSVAKSLKK